MPREHSDQTNQISPSLAQDSALGQAAVDGQRSKRTMQLTSNAISSTRPAMQF